MATRLKTELHTWVDTCRAPTQTSHSHSIEKTVTNLPFSPVTSASYGLLDPAGPALAGRVSKPGLETSVCFPPRGAWPSSAGPGGTSTVKLPMPVASTPPPFPPRYPEPRPPDPPRARPRQAGSVGLGRGRAHCHGRGNCRQLRRGARAASVAMSPLREVLFGGQAQRISPRFVLEYTYQSSRTWYCTRRPLPVHQATIRLVSQAGAMEGASFVSQDLVVELNL